jgi:hypothetical protein
MELYQMAEKKKAKDRKDMDLDEILINKNPEEYTFKPNISRRKVPKAENPGSPVVPRSQKLHEA